MADPINNNASIDPKGGISSEYMKGVDGTESYTDMLRKILKNYITMSPSVNDAGISAAISKLAMSPETMAAIYQGKNPQIPGLTAGTVSALGTIAKGFSESYNKGRAPLDKDLLDILSKGSTLESEQAKGSADWRSQPYGPAMNEDVIAQDPNTRRIYIIPKGSSNGTAEQIRLQNTGSADVPLYSSIPSSPNATFDYNKKKQGVADMLVKFTKENPNKPLPLALTQQADMFQLQDEDISAARNRYDTINKPKGK